MPIPLGMESDVTDTPLAQPFASSSDASRDVPKPWGTCDDSEGVAGLSEVRDPHTGSGDDSSRSSTSVTTTYHDDFDSD